MSDNKPKPNKAKPKTKNRGNRNVKSEPVNPLDEFWREDKENAHDNYKFAELLSQQVKVSGFEQKAYEDFLELPICNKLKANIRHTGKEKTLPIQSYGIQPALKGRDILGCAPTGTGKTWAFLVPIVEILYKKDRDGNLKRPVISKKDEKHDHINVYEEKSAPNCLILAPTRELAIQLYQETQKLTRNTGLTSDYVIGGHKHSLQLVKKEINILIATPGRLISFLRAGPTYSSKISLENLEILVIDEADRMLDMGFKSDIDTIFKASPKNTFRPQTLMYSATFPDKVKKLAKQYLSPKFVSIVVGPPGSVNLTIKQKIIEVQNTTQKFEMVFDMVTEIFENDKKEKEKSRKQGKIHHTPQIIIFTNHVNYAETIADKIYNQTEIDAETVHSDKIQKCREIAIQQFKDERYHVLVATNIAGRGLDIPRVDYVINFDLPRDVSEYVHRVGRTGRAGRVGRAISFFTHKFDYKLGPHLCTALDQLELEVPDFLDQYRTDVI